MSDKDYVNIDDIQVDGLQTRVEMNEDTVTDYQLAMRNRKSGGLPPVDVFKDDDGMIWLADGFHRREAALRHRTAGRSLP